MWILYTLLSLLAIAAMLALFAGTKEPIWAMSTMSAVWRIRGTSLPLVGPGTSARMR